MKQTLLLGQVCAKGPATEERASISAGGMLFRYELDSISVFTEW